MFFLFFVKDTPFPFFLALFSASASSSYDMKKICLQSFPPSSSLEEHTTDNGHHLEFSSVFFVFASATGLYPLAGLSYQHLNNFEKDKMFQGFPYLDLR